MGKRAAAQTAAPKAKAAKPPQRAACPEDAEVAAEYLPVMEILGRSDLPEACRSMLAMMAPYSLGPLRHPFQDRMVAVLESVFSGVEAERQGAVADVEARLSEVFAEQGSSTSVAATAREKVDGVRQARDATDAAMKEAEKGAGAAREALAAERDRERGLASERDAAEKEKAEYEHVAREVLGPLKAGDVDPKQRRLKGKMIDRVMQMLGDGVDVSLKEALPAALKLKPTARGGFAQKAVDFGEELIASHVAALKCRLEGLEADAPNRSRAVAVAEEAVEAAQRVHDETTNAFIDAENALLEVDAAQKEAAAVVEELVRKAQELEAALAAAKADLAKVQDLGAKFRALKEGPKAAEAAAGEPEAEAEEVALLATAALKAMPLVSPGRAATAAIAGEAGA